LFGKNLVNIIVLKMWLTPSFT